MSLRGGLQDTTRLLKLPFPGYRVVVTEPDGSQRWANLPTAGTEMFTSDHMAGGTLGGQWRNKRLPHVPADLGEVGYNQVLLLFNPFIQPKQQLLRTNRHSYNKHQPLDGAVVLSIPLISAHCTDSKPLRRWHYVKLAP